MKCLVIILSFIFFSGLKQECNRLTKIIIKHQKKSIKSIEGRELKLIYKEVLHKKRLKLLFEELNKRGENVKKLKLIETYHITSSRRSGIVWNNSFAYCFIFDDANEKMNLERKKHDFSDYSSQIDIDVEVIRFLDKASNDISLEHIPWTGKGGDLFCVFSDIQLIEENYEVSTLLFREN